MRALGMYYKISFIRDHMLPVRQLQNEPALGNVPVGWAHRHTRLFAQFSNSSLFVTFSGFQPSSGCSPVVLAGQCTGLVPESEQEHAVILIDDDQTSGGSNPQGGFWRLFLRHFFDSTYKVMEMQIAQRVQQLRANPNPLGGYHRPRSESLTERRRETRCFSL